jgi:hypothetical protein
MEEPSWQAQSMKFRELKELFERHPEKAFQLVLPSGDQVPVSFHVTEVGHVRKTFIDCGGTLRELECCQLQVWVGEDGEHRLESGKAAAILEKARSFLPDETIPVEIEYEDCVISLCTIEGHELAQNAVVLNLEHKHTDCLAKERCGIPAPIGDGSGGEAPCCAGRGCC